MRFPIICKPTVAHGSKSAHEMVLVFNERDLNVCRPPCVVQSFVNHNAVLHKVFIIGNRFVNYILITFGRNFSVLFIISYKSSQ